MDYNKLLEKARKVYAECVTNAEKRRLESIFPELKESVDERIRKELIETIHLAYDCGCSLNREQRDKYLAWLEKQDPKKHEEELEKAYKCADEVQYRKGYEDAKCEIEKQGEQKPMDWKPYDEETLEKIKELIDAHFSEHVQRAVFKRWLDEHISQPTKWSDDDEKMMQFILKSINASNYAFENIQIWFRNIKNRVQPQWKPTDGQMQALELVVQYHAFADQDKREKIVALFNDLKKL